MTASIVWMDLLPSEIVSTILQILEPYPNPDDDSVNAFAQHGYTLQIGQSEVGNSPLASRFSYVLVATKIEPSFLPTLPGTCKFGDTGRLFRMLQYDEEADAFVDFAREDGNRTFNSFFPPNGARNLLTFMVSSIDEGIPPLSVPSNHNIMHAPIHIRARELNREGPKG
ncbi:hypothetical protein HK097_002144 [Rhizophlyctis rosea]|uniref:Uncharacterized protein n=1 Tax=Rhizophlyctis rosea TaxID=64517 RepID=A0AAD5X0V2_9FUNG|nr:hypothetical protein HK097_002144 [Rhizophlyctis rosea]